MEPFTTWALCVIAALCVLCAIAAAGTALGDALDRRLGYRDQPRFVARRGWK